MNILGDFFYHLTKSDLKHILKSSYGYIYKVKAAHLLLGMNLNNNELCLIIETAPQKQSVIAANYLFEQKPNGEELCFVLKHGAEESKIKASNIIFEKFSYSDFLICIIENAPFSIKIEAVKKLFEKEELNNYELQKIINLGQPFNDAAIEKTLSLIPNNDVLHSIIYHGNENQKKRARDILDKKFFKKKPI